MNISDFTFKIPLHMRWSDMDELGHINNAVYATFYEEGRGRFLMQCCQWNWSIDGIILAKITIDFLSAMRVDDSCQLYVRISRIGTKSFDMEYAIFNKKGDLCANGTTVQVAIEMTNFTPIAVPEYIKKAVLAYEKQGSVKL